jgi:hypothetical protein
MVLTGPAGTGKDKDFVLSVYSTCTIIPHIENYGLLQGAVSYFGFARRPTRTKMLYMSAISRS